MDKKLLGRVCFAVSAMLGYFEIYDREHLKMFKGLFTEEEMKIIHECKQYPNFYDLIV